MYDSQSVSNFYCVYTIIEDVHTEFKKVVLTEYSAFKSSSKIIQEQAATAIIIALISRKASQGKREKRRVCVKPWLKNETLLAELRLEDEFNYNILQRMVSENFEEIFQLMKGEITKENTKMRELISPDYNLQPQLAFYQKGNYTKIMFMSIILSTQL